MNVISGFFLCHFFRNGFHDTFNFHQYLFLLIGKKMEKWKMPVLIFTIIPFDFYSFFPIRNA